MRIEVQHVSKSFKHNGQRLNVLDDVSLVIEQGEFVSVLGPTGCGKSTLVNLIAGLEMPDTGSVLVNGNPVTGPGPRRVVVFQEAALFPWLSVLGNVEFGLRMANVPKAERYIQAIAYIKLVHLSKFTRALPHQLSGGMKQRVALARALAMQPEILLLDEPFGALDAQTRSILQEELLEIWQKTGRSVLFVTHNVREATGLSDRVYLISSRPGQIRNVETIDVPRPRRADNAELLSYQSKIISSLGEEIQKVMQDELGETIRRPETGSNMPPDRSLGMHI